MTKVLVLGCGPSGLLAAHAARLTGATVIVISQKRPSHLFGCQYLHAAIPEIALPHSQLVHYQLWGSPGEYAEKVYGEENLPFVPSVSPDDLEEDHAAWDIRRAYDILWNMFERDIHDVRLVPSDVPGMLGYYQPDHVFSSVPAPLLCVNPMHNFKSTKCWAIGDAPERGQRAPSIAPPFTVICDGTRHQGWYRASNVYGYQTVEWPGWRNKPPISGVVDFLKPLMNDCDCWPQLVRVGRMGKWQKGVLAHETFEEVFKALS